MKLTDGLDLRGRLTLQKRTSDNQILEEIQANNSIVLTGRDLVAKLFIKETKDTIKPVSHVGVGTGTKPVTTDDTALANEIHKKSLNRIEIERDLQSIEIDTTAGTSSRRKLMLTVDLDLDEANGALTEAGLFTEDGVMYNRVTFPPINKSQDFKLTLIWEILF